MITLHSHLQPQYKYELFHVHFTSFHCTGRYELNKLTSLPMCGFIAQLVEHRTGIAEVTGSNPVEALIFSGFFFPICLNWKIYCDDHSSLSFLTIACTVNNCFSRSNAKFTLIHKCMPLPTHQHGVKNRDKAYCRFAIISYLIERNTKLIIT